MPSLIRGASRRSTWKIIGLAMAAWGLTVAGIFGYERTMLWASRDGATFDGRPAEPLLKFRMPGIVRPPVVGADASGLRPDEEVFGLVVGGRARAYRLDALRDRSKHVVNDLVGGVPVTVAYCDVSDCVSAYRGPEASGPLDVSIGGLFENPGDGAGGGRPPLFPEVRGPGHAGDWPSPHPARATLPDQDDLGGVEATTSVDRGLRRPPLKGTQGPPCPPCQAGKVAGSIRSPGGLSSCRTR